MAAHTEAPVMSAATTPDGCVPITKSCAELTAARAIFAITVSYAIRSTGLSAYTGAKPVDASP